MRSIPPRGGIRGSWLLNAEFLFQFDTGSAYADHTDSLRECAVGLKKGARRKGTHARSQETEFRRQKGTCGAATGALRVWSGPSGLEERPDTSRLEGKAI